MTRKNLLYIVTLAILLCFSACSDDSFSSSTSNLLTFSTDSVHLDTIFSTVPSSTRSFWVYNNSSDGIRCTSVRLQNGNQSGFRVNVDGSYLGPTSGYKLSDVEIRKGDSIRVFVEATLTTRHNEGPQKAEDNLIFTLESGREQTVNLNAYAWDADILRNVIVSSDSTISNLRPTVVYGGIHVNSGATLSIEPGTTIYFHDGAGIDVEGRLICEGTATEKITLRGDRLDKMFDYLPYDRVSGQWEGLHFMESSYNNSLAYTDLHSTYDGIVADSASVDQLKLQLSASTIHNCQGDGVRIENGFALIENCQITNTLGDCLHIDGGRVQVNNCTIAQFYPFDSARGNALNITNNKGELNPFYCLNSIITGYADDVIQGQFDESDSTRIFAFQFEDCILRTPRITEADSVYYVRVVFENVEDTLTTGRKLFTNIDADMQYYDFHLAAESAAIGQANPQTASATDLDGNTRDETPDLGCYEYQFSSLSLPKRMKIR